MYYYLPRVINNSMAQYTVLFILLMFTIILFIFPCTILKKKNLKIINKNFRNHPIITSLAPLNLFLDTLYIF